MNSNKDKKTRLKPSDIKAILYELDAWQRRERGDKLTWGFLENFSGYSRQSLWAKEEIKNHYNNIKSILKSNKMPNSNQYRQTLEQRIKTLEAEIAKLKIQQNNWLELWARYEYNAKIAGLDPKKLENPLPEIYR